MRFQSEVACVCMYVGMLYVYACTYVHNDLMIEVYKFV